MTRSKSLVTRLLFMPVTEDVRPDLLLLDDDPMALETLSLVLGDRFVLRRYTAVAAAEESLRATPPRAAILDFNLGSETGLAVLARWKERFPDLDVLFCSGEIHAERAMECLRHGASEYVTKPFEPETLLCVVERLLAKTELKRGLERLRPLVRPLPVSFVGESRAARALRQEVARLRTQTSLHVLLLGETGTGKEVVARLLHQQEDSPERPFVVANMPALPSTLVEAELFGVEKGAYTDAKCARAGRFEMADGGDIFLDEIADIAPDTQAKLLRVLQERQIERVGSTRPKRLRFRAIAATNQPIGRLASEKRFREDLLFRLGDVVIELPPLRDRRDDIPALVAHFAARHGKLGGERVGNETPTFSSRALEQLEAHHWPGNVRELESTVKRAIAFAPGPEIDELPRFGAPFPGCGSAAIAETVETLVWDERREAAEKKAIAEALARCKGNRGKACSALGLSRATFYRRMKQYGFNVDRNDAKTGE